MKNKDGEPTYNQPHISLARRKQGMGKELAILERSAFLLRVGQYRLAWVPDHENRVLEIHRIEHRSGAYTADD